jgi:hypothetical protein
MSTVPRGSGEDIAHEMLFEAVASGNNDNRWLQLILSLSTCLKLTATDLFL